MDKLVNIVTIVAAACFAGSAALLYGQFMGLGHRDLVWYTTFSDIVNHAPATMLAYGATLASVIYWDTLHTHLVQTGSRWRYVGDVVFFVAIIALFYFSPTALTVTTGSSLAILSIAVMFRDRIIDALGATAYKLIDGGLWAVFVLMMFGYLLGYNSLHSDWGVKVTVAGQPKCAATSIPLDRGLFLIRGPRYELIPWDKIEQTSNVKKTDAAPKPNQKVGTCFGMI